MARLIKWVGDPGVYLPDGVTPVSKKYENNRQTPVPYYDRVGGGLENGTYRIVTKRGKDLKSKEYYETGLSRTYVWSPDDPSFVIRMKDEDWEVLKKRCPREFVDVTDVPPDRWSQIGPRNIVLAVDPRKTEVGLPPPRIQLVRPAGFESAAT